MIIGNSKNFKPRGEIVPVSSLGKYESSFQRAQQPAVRREMAKNLVKSWESFFLDWRSQSREDTAFLKSTLEQQIEESRTLSDQNNKLEDLNKELLSKIEYLVSEVNAKKLEEEERRCAKLKRKNAKSRPPLDVISKTQLDYIISLVDQVHQGKVSRARAKIAFVLLYYTGLRISNLLILRWFDFFELQEKGEAIIPIIKRGSQNQIIHVGRSGQRDLNALQSEIDLLKMHCFSTLDGFVFSIKKGPDILNPPSQKKHIKRAKFNTLINAVLIRASLELQKNLRSHSFRTTFITDLLNNEVPIHKVKDLIGHKSISTTARYNRSVLTKKLVRKTIGHLNKIRAQEVSNENYLENEL